MKYAKVRVADQNVRLPFWHMLRDFLYDKRIPVTSSESCLSNAWIINETERSHINL